MSLPAVWKQGLGFSLPVFFFFNIHVAIYNRGRPYHITQALLLLQGPFLGQRIYLYYILYIVTIF